MPTLIAFALGFLAAVGVANITGKGGSENKLHAWSAIIVGAAVFLLVSYAFNKMGS